MTDEKVERWTRTAKFDPHGDLGPAEEWVNREEADAALARVEASAEMRVKEERYWAREWEARAKAANAALEKAEAERDEARAKRDLAQSESADRFDAQSQLYKEKRELASRIEALEAENAADKKEAPPIIRQEHRGGTSIRGTGEEPLDKKEGTG